MIARTIGRRYSKALLSLALQRKEPLEELQRELVDLSECLFSDHRVMTFLMDPNVPLSSRAAALEKILAAVESRPLVTHLMMLLLRKGRIGFVPDIICEFQQFVDIQGGVVRASVASATELSPEDQERIRNILHHRFKKKIVLSVSVDPDLIGGLVIKVGSLSFDGSLRTQLKDIQSQLLDEVPFS